MTVTLDEYLNSLDSSAIGFYKITEEEDKSDTRSITSLVSKASTLLSKVKNKKEAKDNIKKIESNEKTKKIESIIKANIAADGSFNKIKAKKSIINELFGSTITNLEYNPLNIISLILNAFDYMIFRIKNRGLFPVHQFASLISVIFELPETALIRLISRTNKSHIQLKTELEKDPTYSNINLTSLLLILLQIFIAIGIISFGGANIAVLTVASLILIIISVVKLIYGVYIGSKRNSWKYYEKLVKSKLSESIYYAYGNYLESAVFISSIREELVNKSKNNKQFLQNEATDYEILYLTIEGKFPETTTGDCQILIDILNVELKINLVSLEEVDISTQGINPNILIETIFNDASFNKTFLSESYLLETVDPSKLKQLKDLMDKAKKEFIKNHPDRGGDAEKAKEAGAAFQDAKERYETYRQSGVDPGEGSYTKGTGQQSRGGFNSGGPDWFSSFINKVWTFNPKVEILKILRKVYGAEKLANVIKVTPALAGGVILLSGAVVTALFTWASYRAYSRFFSQAAKSCSSEKDSLSKSICMKKYEIEALTSRYKDLSKVIPFCTKLKASETNSCKLSLQGKLDDIKHDLDVAKNDLTKLSSKKAA